MPRTRLTYVLRRELTTYTSRLCYLSAAGQVRHLDTRTPKVGRLLGLARQDFAIRTHAPRGLNLKVDHPPELPRLADGKQKTELRLPRRHCYQWTTPSSEPGSGLHTDPTRSTLEVFYLELDLCYLLCC